MFHGSHDFGHLHSIKVIRIRLKLHMRFWIRLVSLNLYSRDRLTRNKRGRLGITQSLNPLQWRETVPG